ncbi:two pore channel protein 2-like [Rhopilema esculentum]|uniref:two pore channel protein 2-like n=1 Tax=Rhopilema esculentum TaxID=499914 RepID=UPI0031D816DA
MSDSNYQSADTLDHSGDQYINEYAEYSEDPLISSLDATDIITSSQETLNEDLRENRALLQATVFVEDAIEHRSVFHKVDTRSLSLYRIYHSTLVRWILRITISSLLALAFFEYPSSLTISADPSKIKNRPNPPCGLTEAIELFCLLILTCDFTFKFVMIGKRQARKSKWLIGYFFVLFISYLDLVVTFGYKCKEHYRIRRLLRPFFILQNSSVMKKTVQSVKQTIPEILSVLFLFGLHLFFFTMFGMILFPRKNNKMIDFLSDSGEGKEYFKDLGSSIISLIVLLTTANNPDVMMPAYQHSRLYAVYFISYLAIGLYFFMNMLLAVIYNQFRGSFMRSMQASFFRRRLGIRAAFEILKGSGTYGSQLHFPSDAVSKYSVKRLLDRVKFSRKSRYLPMMLEKLSEIDSHAITACQFQMVFDVVFEDSVKRRPPVRSFENGLLKRLQKIIKHSYFQYFGDLMAFFNAFVITIELVQGKSNPETGASLVKFNLCFIIYYAVEQVLLIYFIGRKRYFSHKHILFEFMVTLLLVVVEGVYLGFYGKQLGSGYIDIRKKSEEYGFFSAWNLLRITNMLIIVRLFRIIPSIKPLSLVAGTLSDLVKNMRPFGGVIVVIYYVFAIFGMMLFQGNSPKPDSPPRNYTCGTYEQLNYYSNNFDDFGAALVVLWDVMVVNNWYIFLNAYKKTTSTPWSQAYFIIWWFVSVVLCANLLIALVLEAFFTQLEKNQENLRRKTRRKFATNEETTRHFRVHQMFRNDMREPGEDELLNELNKQHYLRPYINYRPMRLLDD